MRRLRAFAVVAGLVAVAAASAAAGGSAPTTAGRPDPLLTNLQLDYGSPLAAAGGGTATLARLAPGVQRAALDDLSYLRYRELDDWGGFELPRLGSSALGSSGRGGPRAFVLHGAGRATSLQPQPRPQPQPKPSGNPPVPQPPLPSSNPVPCANAGFGGTACASTHPTPRPLAHHPRRRKPKHKHPRKRLYECGTRGLSIVSDLPHCRFDVANGVPGSGAVEHLRIRNKTHRRFRLSFKAKGSRSPLWDYLQLGVWRTGRGAPTPLPPLRYWTHGFTRLVTVKPGKTVRITIQLYLPASAGNAAQHQSARLAFVWRAVA